MSESYNVDIGVGEGFKVGCGGMGFESISDMLKLDSVISSPKSISGRIGISFIPVSVRAYKSWMIIPNYENAKKQVIKNKNVIGVYNNVAEALENTKEPIGSYILQECNGKESGYTSYISSFDLFKV